MKNTTLSLPGSAEEYLRTVMGRAAVISVLMQDGRMLKIEYSLSPRYSCEGKALHEGYKYCPDCGVML